MCLLDSGANTNVPNKRGETPLHLAAKHNNCTVMRQLLDNYAHCAYFDARDKSDTTPLFHAVKHVEATRLLIDFGADVNARNRYGTTPLIAMPATSSVGRLSVTRLLLNAGANLNACDNDGMTALHMACDDDDDKWAKLLLERGADVNANGSTGTPLHCAAELGSVECVRLLLQWGADTRAIRPKNKTTALHYAVQRDRKRDITQLLVEAGADVNAADSEGAMPMHELLRKHIQRRLFLDDEEEEEYEADNDDDNETTIDMVRLLVKNGADINAIDNDGHTPLFDMYATMLRRVHSTRMNVDDEVDEEYEERV